MVSYKQGGPCLLLGEAEVADFNGGAGGVAQVGQQIVALEVKVHHMPAVQVLHACAGQQLIYMQGLTSNLERSRVPRSICNLILEPDRSSSLFQKLQPGALLSSF